MYIPKHLELVKKEITDHLENFGSGKKSAVSSNALFFHTTIAPICNLPQSISSLLQPSGSIGKLIISAAIDVTAEALNHDYPH